VEDLLADLLSDDDDAALARAGRLVTPSETVESLASWAASTSATRPPAADALDPSQAPETARLIDEFGHMLGRILDDADSPPTKSSDTTEYQESQVTAEAQARNATDAPAPLALKTLPFSSPQQPRTTSGLRGQAASAVYAHTTSTFSFTPTSAPIHVIEVRSGPRDSFSSAAEYRRHVAIPRYMRKRKNRQWDSTPLYATRTNAANRRVRKNGRFKKRTTTFVSVSEMSRLQDSNDEAQAETPIATSQQPVTSVVSVVPVTSVALAAGPYVAEV